MVGITYAYIDTIFEFYGYVNFFNPSLLLGWIFEHDCLDTYALYVCIALVQHN